jgi:hypothetical protein
MRRDIDEEEANICTLNVFPFLPSSLPNPPYIMLNRSDENERRGLGGIEIIGKQITGALEFLQGFE